MHSEVEFIFLRRRVPQYFSHSREDSNVYVLFLNTESILV